MCNIAMVGYQYGQLRTLVHHHTNAKGYLVPIYETSVGLTSYQYLATGEGG